MKNRNGKFSLSALFDNRRFTAIFSLVLAILIWIVVIVVVDPDTSKDISVPVDFAYNSTAYESLGLDIVEKPTQNITVHITGDGSVLGGLTANDLLVYPDYSVVKDAGEYQLTLQIKKTDATKRFTITSPVEQTITVRFDKVVTQKFTVTVNVTGVQPADGYYMDIASAAPGEVTLSGPEDEMSRVDKVVANVELNEVRSESAIVTAKLTYLDANGDPLLDSYITADAEQVEVTIPILKVRELPLQLDFANVPSGYDPAVLGAQMSENTVRVAGPAATVDSLKSISVEPVDLTTFRLGERQTRKLTLPDGVRSIDGLTEVTVSFDTTGYAVKTIAVSQLRVINEPKGVTVTFSQDKLYNVTLVGERSELDALAATGVVAQVDASAVSITRGQQNISAQIIVPSTKTVFATGSYTVLCNINSDSAPAPAEASSDAAG